MYARHAKSITTSYTIKTFYHANFTANGQFSLQFLCDRKLYPHSTTDTQDIKAKMQLHCLSDRPGFGQI